MKTEISRDSHQSKKRYTGVYQQQGRMLTDADWNELVDILKARVRESLQDVIGKNETGIGGTPRQRALRIVDDAGIKIQPGYVYINGTAAALTGEGPLEFDQQPDFPAPPPPSGDYKVYADIWERTVTQLLDGRLRDSGLHGADTCTRKEMLAQVKWCPDAVNPEQFDGNPHKGDAGLTLTLLQKISDPDACDPCAAELDIDSPVGNYLFRVEVHDVQGDANAPTGITLKWSGENGAEHFPALAGQEEMPAGFISDKWVYEFLDQTTERHLGVHLNTTGWSPARLGLRHFGGSSGTYSVPPSIPGSSESDIFVRRWNGYCKLDLVTGELLEGMDRGVPLATDNTPDSLGHVEIGPVLKILLGSLSLEMKLGGSSFVAGDYWLADVREAEHAEGSVLLDAGTPLGIEHNYLKLAHVVGGVLQTDPERDRKYAFPPLNRMTRLFSAGGDGQEIVPGQPLPQPLRVGVANGEWPVAGATVRFDLDGSDGTLNVINGGLTDADGIARCEWSPTADIGATCRVKATLVDPDNPADPSADLAPPVYFYANLVSADQVAYAPACLPDAVEHTVHHLLLGPDDTRLGGDGYYSVKEVLDALLCELRAEHVPYNPVGQGGRWDDISEGGDRPVTVQQALDELAKSLESTDIRYEVPTCGTAAVPTVRSKLDIDPGTIKIDQILTSLLCDFKATHLPLDRTADLCSGLASDASVKTVQDALNYLCEHTGGVSCSVTVGVGGQFDTLDQAFQALQGKKEICICLLPGEYRIEKVDSLRDMLSVRITGCGAQVSKIFIVNTLAMQSIEVQLRDISVIGGEDEKKATQAGSLLLSGIGDSHVVVENCVFNRLYQGDPKKWLPPVLLEGPVTLDWHQNSMTATRVDEKVSGAIIPDKGALSGPSLAVAKKLEDILASNRHTDPAAYDKKLDEVAGSIVTLSNQARNKLFNARPVDNINGLPSGAVSIHRMDRSVHEASVTPVAPLVDRNALAAANRRMMPSSVHVSPKKTAEGLFKDIKSASPADVDKVTDRIRDLATLAAPYDYALALASNEVGGSISGNEIAGNLALHFAQQDAVPMSWRSTATDNRQKHKKVFANGFIGENRFIQQQLHLKANTLNELHSLMSAPLLKDLEAALEGNLAGSFEFALYESEFISENLFLGNNNSFAGRFLNLINNHFLFENEKGTALAHLLGYRGIINGNHSMELDNDAPYIIDQVLTAYLPSDKTNFLTIV